MKKIISTFFIVSVIIANSAIAGASTIVDFYDTAKDWDGFGTSYGDVVGTPELTGGRFIFDHHTFTGIELDYTSTGFGYLPGDWFFDVDQDGNWDYVLHNQIAKHRRHWLPENNYKLYEVDMPIYKKSNYVRANHRGERKGHPTQAKNKFLKHHGLLDDTIDFSGWSYDFYDVSEDNPATSVWSNFGIDLDAYAGTTMTYAFAMTCANDVLFGEVRIPSPEPGTFILLGFGALGIFLYERRRRSRA